MLKIFFVKFEIKYFINKMKKNFVYKKLKIGNK